MRLTSSLEALAGIEALVFAGGFPDYYFGGHCLLPQTPVEFELVFAEKRGGIDAMLRSVRS